ncbi:MAG: 5'-nucleotidase C-terminal domain-containing protein [Deltaproteobacteria bacterium]|nr:5'-nucleotidase C-terminal domain-containing protein [Deltaproteobacteria bacterium]
MNERTFIAIAATVALAGSDCDVFNESCPVTTPEVWGQVAVDLIVREDYTRRCEAPVGNFMADALLNYDYDLTDEGADVNVRMALFNSGAIREEVTCGALENKRERIPQGPITDQDIYQLMPFYEDSVVVVRMDATILKQVMERSVANLGLSGSEGAKGHFLHVAGERGVQIQVDCGAQAQQYDEENGVIDTPGERITGICLGPPDDCREVVGTLYVATLDFLVGSSDGKPNDGFAALHDPSVQVLETYLPVIDVIRPWIAGYAALVDDPDNYPRVEGRLDYLESCAAISDECNAVK